jgi:hypothetical protein
MNQDSFTTPRKEKNLVCPPAPKKQRISRSPDTFSLNVLPTCYAVNLTTEPMAFNNLENAVNLVQENIPFFLEMVVIENGMITETIVNPEKVSFAKVIEGNAPQGSIVSVDGDYAVYV